MNDRTAIAGLGALYRRCGLTAALIMGIGLLGGQAFAQSADVTYVQGSVDLQPSGQPRSEAFIGDSMNPGDSIITGSDGLAQLQKANLADITVSPGTVFTLRRFTGKSGSTENVLWVSLGSSAFKFNELGAKEPVIATDSAAAGIRGTQLKVFAGADGSSLFVVQSGKVVVSGASGTPVDLTADQGVEVNPGGPPGQKIKVLHGQVNYSTWNAGKLDALLKDPAGAAARVQNQMQSYIAHIDKLWTEYQNAYKELTAERNKLVEVQRKDGKKAGADYYLNKVLPLEKDSRGLFLNLRYYTLSALSLRRYVLGVMYLRMTSSYILRQSSPTYESFLRVYRQIIASYDKSVVAHLVAADI